MLYNFLYYFAIVYLVITAICCLVAGIVIFWDIKRYTDQLNNIPVQFPAVKFIVAILVPVIFGLGWIFIVPFLPFRKKGS